LTPLLERRPLADRPQSHYTELLMSVTPTTDNSHIPLAYAARPPGRPGVLTAVGILSIVLGLLSILAGMVGIITGVKYLRISRVFASMPPMVVTVPTAGAGAIGATSVNYSTTVNTAAIGGSGTALHPATTGIISSPSFPAGAAILMITEATLSVCLGIFLIIAGIWMLCDSRAAGRFHRIYVALKIPLVAAAAIATWWTMSGMMGSVTGIGAPTAMPNLIGIIYAAVTSGFALLYPIALLIALSSRTAKAHFNTFRPSSG
jgi:hypothetical protein